MPWTEISYLSVGVVQWWRGFGHYLPLLWITASALGYFFPCVQSLPFFVMFWVLLARSNEDKDMALYIGQLKNKENDFGLSEGLSDESNTIAHWIVALDDGEDHFNVTHAVGLVSLGKGTKLPFTSREKGEVDSKYYLHHVGWMSRRNLSENMQLVTDNEPMKSGYTCQEYAVDIVFQFSSSRTYTYIKILLLPRVRNFVCWSLIILSLMNYIVTEVWHTQPLIIIVPLSTNVFNPITVFNTFTALECYRLGFTNNLLTQVTSSHQSFRDRLQIMNANFYFVNNGDFLKFLVVTLYLAIFYMYIKNWIFTLLLALLLIIIARR